MRSLRRHTPTLTTTPAVPAITTGDPADGPPAAAPDRANRIFAQVVRRRKWSLHRHVHLRAAFEEANTRAPVRRMLTVGCGAGLSELYLAARHPELALTLTDFDPGRLGAARRAAANLGVDNVTFRRLDLLSPPDGPTYDLVTGTEVLEHIGPDDVAATNLLAWTHGHVWVLVPHCADEDLTDPRRVRREWERHGHHRPGYSSASLRRLFDGGQPSWVRRCYYAPDAARLRAVLNAHPDDELLRHAGELERLAARDVRDDPSPDHPAAGIEILVRSST